MRKAEPKRGDGVGVGWGGGRAHGSCSPGAWHSCRGTRNKGAGPSYGEVSECQAEKLEVTFFGKIKPLRVFKQRRLMLAELEGTESGSSGCAATGSSSEKYVVLRERGVGWAGAALGRLTVQNVGGEH